MFNDWQTASAMQLVEIKNELGSAMVSLMGAHVISYKKANSEDILWMSDQSYMEYGKPIRGGIPVCWPWFGPHPDKERKLPSHGLGRIALWDVKEKTECPDGSSKLVLTLPGSRLPDEFSALDAEIEIIVGSSLKMNLKTTNNGEKDYDLTQALHTYFNVSDAEAITVEDLDSLVYLDTVTNEYGIQYGPLKIDREIDRIFRTCGSTRIIDPGFNRIIHIDKYGSNSTVVWNPWIDKSKRMPDFGDEEYHTMLCVEAAKVPKFGDEGVVSSGMIYELRQVIRVENIE